MPVKSINKGPEVYVKDPPERSNAIKQERSEKKVQRRSVGRIRPKSEEGTQARSSEDKPVQSKSKRPKKQVLFTKPQALWYPEKEDSDSFKVYSDRYFGICSDTRCICIQNFDL